jgi:hypothetical protein
MGVPRDTNRKNSESVEPQDKTVPSNKAPFSEKDLSGFKYFNKISSLLNGLHDTYKHSNRKLHYDQYISAILFYFFNPILTSLRGLQATTELKKVQKTLGIKATSRTCLSEANHLFDPALIEPIISKLAKQASPVEKHPHLQSLYQELTAVDGTVLPALPKMLWALWMDEEHRAAKLHLAFSVTRHVPWRASITEATASEIDEFRKSLAPNHLYLLDGGYGQYRLFKDICDAGSSFVSRIHDNAVWKTIEELPLTDEDKRAGIIQDEIVRLGCASRRDDCPMPLRVVKIEYHALPTAPRSKEANKNRRAETTDPQVIILVTDQLDLPAEVVALLYKYRWQIELFFRWFKCILSCQHLLAHSKNGVTLQVYCALIASLLISLWTGKKPTKRTFELICFYMSGWADEEELFAHIEKLKEAQPQNTP